MKNLIQILLLIFVFSSCEKDKNDVDFLNKENNCECLAYREHLNGKEFLHPFYKTTNCRDTGKIVYFQGLQFKVRCSRL